MKKKLEKLMLHPRVRIQQRFSDPIFHIVEVWAENSDGSVMIDVDTGTYIASIGISRRSAFDENDEDRGYVIARDRALKSLYNKMFPASDVKPHVYKAL